MSLYTAVGNLCFHFSPEKSGGGRGGATICKRRTPNLISVCALISQLYLLLFSIKKYEIANILLSTYQKAVKIEEVHTSFITHAS